MRNARKKHFSKEFAMPQGGSMKVMEKVFLKGDIMNKLKFMIALTVLALSLSACGDAGEDNDRGKDNDAERKTSSSSVDENVGHDGSGSDTENSQSQSTQADLPRNYADETAEVTIYKITNDSVVVYITGTPCESVAAKGTGKSGEKKFRLELSDGQLAFNLETFNSYLYNDDSSVYYSSGSSDGKTYAGKNSYFTRIDEEGVASAVREGGEYTLKIMGINSGLADAMILAEGKTSDITKTLTEANYRELSAKIYEDGTAENKAQADWEGKYILSYSRDGNYGWIDCHITEGGTVSLNIDMGETKLSVYAEEGNYDKAEYAYGTYVTAKAIPLNLGSNSNFEIKYNAEPERTYINVKFSGYLNDEYTSIDENFDKFIPWYTAPADYEDKDEDGYISALNVTSDPYFTPETDDYTIVYDPEYKYWTDNGSIDCHRAVLEFYDANGHSIKEITQYICTSESDAAVVYEKAAGIGYEAQRNGKSVYTVYDERDISSYKSDTIFGQAGSAWYKNCHYAYPYNYRDGYSKAYLYIRKPYTDENFTIDAESELMWKNFGSSAFSYRSTDVQGLNFSGNVGKGYQINFPINGIPYPFEELSYFPACDGEVRFHGSGAVAVSYQDEYRSSDRDDPYDHYICFREYSFSVEETAINDYIFKVDSTENPAVTFDNYKEKTPDFTFTAHFDMTRKN